MRVSRKCRHARGGSRSAWRDGPITTTIARRQKVKRSGHIKVITARNGKIVGATIVGAQAGELIATWALAISQGLNVRAFTNVVLPYPTLSELGKRAAMDFFAPRLTGAWVRRIIAWLRIFG